MSSVNQNLSRADYKFRVQQEMLTMPDGVKLAVTYYKPISKTEDEKFPAILEMLPYRKDDFFYLRDYQRASYFAKRGYVIARVDVRGTGGSEGTLPDHEYSDEELNDAITVIAQLSQMYWSSGKVGMYGISWGGFNALMVAQKQPPALKAIIAVNATDDLFYNDVHYIDGVLHMDTYAHQIISDNALPRSPDYRVDEAFFQERFEREPWLFTWFRQQQDGTFWRRESLRFQSPLKTPAYLIGGLLDGYRDFAIRIFQHSEAPVLAEIGPWNHDWPDTGKPGPNYEWRERALRWWDYWLKGINTGILEEPRFMTFVRDGYEPSIEYQEVPGHWRCETTWPLPDSRDQRFYLSAQHQLQPETVIAAKVNDSHSLVYHPGSGMAAGIWWGEQTGDMAADDAQSLVYDSDVLTETLEIIGQPQVSLQVAADGPLYQWTVRLEDVSPTGKVSLVSGALINPSQRMSRLTPQALVPGQTTTLKTKIHFTTWRFKPGHRIRLAIANAQFPMAWPTPTKGKTTLWFGTDTWIDLPLVSQASGLPCLLPIPEKNDESPDGRSLTSEPANTTFNYDQKTGDSVFTITYNLEWEIGPKNFKEKEKYQWIVNDVSPANAQFKGDRQLIFTLPNNQLKLISLVNIQSDQFYFRLTFTRTLFQNGQQIRQKTWSESIPRVYQ